MYIQDVIDYCFRKTAQCISDVQLIMINEIYQGEKVVFKGRKMDPTTVRKNMLSSVLTALEVRFPDGNQNPITKASLITSLSNWPALKSEEIAGLHTVQFSVLLSVLLQFFVHMIFQH